MGADCGMYPPSLMEKIWEQYEKERFISLGVGIDSTYLSEQTIPNFFKTSSVPTEWYDFLGYTGNVHMDYRYHQLFDVQSKVQSDITGQWYYGLSSVSMDGLLKIEWV